MPRLFERLLWGRVFFHGGFQRLFQRLLEPLPGVAKTLWKTLKRLLNDSEKTLKRLLKYSAGIVFSKFCRVDLRAKAWGFVHLCFHVSSDCQFSRWDVFIGGRCYTWLAFTVAVLCGRVWYVRNLSIRVLFVLVASVRALSVSILSILSCLPCLVCLHLAPAANASALAATAIIHAYCTKYLLLLLLPHIGFSWQYLKNCFSLKLLFPICDLPRLFKRLFEIVFSLFSKNVGCPRQCTSQSCHDK